MSYAMSLRLDGTPHLSQLELRIARLESEAVQQAKIDRAALMQLALD
jgi:hypothetical protein